MPRCAATESGSAAGRRLRTQSCPASVAACPAMISRICGNSRVLSAWSSIDLAGARCAGPRIIRLLFQMYFGEHSRNILCILCVCSTPVHHSRQRNSRYGRADSRRSASPIASCPYSYAVPANAGPGETCPAQAGYAILACSETEFNGQRLKRGGCIPGRGC